MSPLSLLDKISTAWSLLITEDDCQYGKSMFLHTINNRKIQTLVGRREAIAVYNISTKFLQFWGYLMPQHEL